MLFTRSMDIQNTNKDICLKFCKSQFVERKGKPVEEEKLFDGFLMSKYFLMRHCLYGSPVFFL